MKRKRTLLWGLMLAGLLGLCWFGSQKFDSFCFRRLTDAFFTRSLESDPLSLHFTLARPERFGVSPESYTLQVYDPDGAQRSADAIRDMLERLSRIRPGHLTEEERYTRDLLISYLNTNLEGTRFSLYEEPLSPSSGMQSELPLLLAEYTLRTGEDVAHYLSLLESVPAYLQGLSDYEAARAGAGLFMPEADALAAAAQCDRLLDANALAEGTHFLQTTFRTRLDGLSGQEPLTAGQREAYLAENDRLLTEAVLPAYQKLSDDLILLSGSGREPGGLCELPEGRAYYAWLVKKTTGTRLDMDSLYTVLQKSFRKNFETLKALVSQYREMTGGLPDPASLSDGFPLTDPSGILTDLQQKMQADFPPLTALSETGISCTVKNVDAALESYTSPAFYMSPPIDDLFHNTICINRSSTSDGIELYTTLAHEGYPGHLYQTVYSSLYGSVQNGQRVRELLFYGGYVEGWAYYTEQLSYDYAAQLLAASGAPDASVLLCRLTSVQRDLQISLYSLLDMALHYYGTAKPDILRSLTSFGLPAETAERVYDYLRTDPAVYLKYYVGFLEMRALRARAEALWDDGFTPLRFHQFVLEAGPSDFASLNRRLTEQAGTHSSTAQTCSARISSILDISRLSRSATASRSY